MAYFVVVAKAINYPNYIVNHTPTKALNNITLEEAWSSVKPDVSHFWVFESTTWAHIPNEKYKALEPKSEKNIFLLHILKVLKDIGFFVQIQYK